MKRIALNLMWGLMAAGSSIGVAAAQETVQFANAPCVTPPVRHCPDKDCPADRISHPGSVVEMKTRRVYYLDYPCDLKKGEAVTVVLNLHGAGSSGNWQRHYFPIFDDKDKYRLVIASPNSPTRVWSEADDEYLKGIVDSVVEQIGKENVKAFWLAGHSQGGITSNRLLRQEFFAARVDGFLSLSGGRLGGSPGRGNFAGRGGAGAAAPGGRGRGGAPPGGAAATGLPATDFSFIFETGEREMDSKGMPEASQIAQRYACGPKGKPVEVVDTKAGYVYDGSRQNPPDPAWGLLARPGKALVASYASCKDGRVVTDIVRLEKGHTEGLEPVITEEIVKLMLTAKGGKLSGR